MGEKISRKDLSKEQLEDVELSMLVDQSEQLRDIKVLKGTKGGKALVDLLNTDTISLVHQITNKYKECSHTELISVCAALEAHLALLRLLNNAEDNLEEVDRLLQDALRE